MITLAGKQDLCGQHRIRRRQVDWPEVPLQVARQAVKVCISAGACQGAKDSTAGHQVDVAASQVEAVQPSLRNRLVSRADKCWRVCSMARSRLDFVMVGQKNS